MLDFFSLFLVLLVSRLLLLFRLEIGLALYLRDFRNISYMPYADKRNERWTLMNKAQFFVVVVVKSEIIAIFIVYYFY